MENTMRIINYIKEKIAAQRANRAVKVLDLSGLIKTSENYSLIFGAICQFFAGMVERTEKVLKENPKAVEEIAIGVTKIVNSLQLLGSEIQKQGKEMLKQEGTSENIEAMSKEFVSGTEHFNKNMETLGQILFGIKPKKKTEKKPEAKAEEKSETKAGKKPETKAEKKDKKTPEVKIHEPEIRFGPKIETKATPQPVKA